MADHMTLATQMTQKAFDAIVNGNLAAEEYLRLADIHARLAQTQVERQRLVFEIDRAERRGV